MLNTTPERSTSTKPGFARFILPALLLLLASNTATAACTCKDEPLVPVGECSVNVKLCGCLEKLEWLFSAEAEEDVSGKTGYGSEQDNPEDATYAAIIALFGEHPELVPQCFPN